MELSLKDAISILDVVKTIDWYSITLWLSLVVPLYYIVMKKLMPEPVPGEKKTIKQWFVKFFTLPKMEAKILFISLFLFVVGTIIAVAGQKEKERIRNLAWALKNHMLNVGYYNMGEKDVSDATGIDTCDLKKIITTFPNEFSYYYDVMAKDEAYRITILLTDSVAKNKIFIKSEKLLAAYLNNDSVLSVGSYIDFQDLFYSNNFFTNHVIYKLISDSSSRFSFITTNVNGKSGFGIVKFKRTEVPKPAASNSSSGK